jgi:hypothetical protein
MYKCSSEISQLFEGRASTVAQYRLVQPASAALFSWVANRALAPLNVHLHETQPDKAISFVVQVIGDCESLVKDVEQTRLQQRKGNVAKAEVGVSFIGEPRDMCLAASVGLFFFIVYFIYRIICTQFTSKGHVLVQHLARGNCPAYPQPTLLTRQGSQVVRV